MAAAPNEPQASVPADDPLIEINGIGPSTQERLYEAGIKTFANWPPRRPHPAQHRRSAATRRYDVEDWIEEARQRRSE